MHFNYLTRVSAANAEWPCEPELPSRPVLLTAKEQEILQWAARGKSTWEIARIQGRTEAAVNFHLCNIRRKFQVNSLKAALILALDQRLIFLH